MRVTFIGVGEAFDEHLPNNSQLLEAGTERGAVRLLVDCGFNVPFAYWKLAAEPAKLDAVFITHFHGDHCFGIPALLLKMRDVGRTETLALIGRPGIRAKAERLMEEAYASLFDTLDFDVEYHELEPEKPLAFKGLTLSCARSGHSSPNFSLRVDAGDRSFFSSGDGHPTPETIELARGCGLAVHEAYAVDEKTEGHGTVSGTIDFGRRAGVKRLALAHVRAGVRNAQRAEIERLMDEVKDFEVFMPEPGQSVEF